MTSEKKLAVIDLGKTNLKIFIINNKGAIIDEYRHDPAWTIAAGATVLDDEAVQKWIERQLTLAKETHDVSGVMVSGHGCTFALVDDHALALPILDYEQSPPAYLEERINNAIPDFYHTFSPPLPLGLNFSRHVIWREEEKPAEFAQANTMLTYPQYWNWVLSGEKASEVSYLGCHSDLWAPMENDFSSLVKTRGWEKLMPPIRRAGSILGQYETKTGSIDVHNGVHDSNAAYYYYQSIGFDDFTLMSTGTWVIIFNSSCPVEALNPHRDMLANVTVDHQLAPTIRYMGGREYDLVSGGATHQVTKEDIQSVIDAGLYVYPSFAAGGPLPDFNGGFAQGFNSKSARAASALLYVAMMSNLSLDLIQSNNDIVIDGGLTKAEYYAPLMAQLRPSQKVFTSPVAQGSALGAAALAFEADGQHEFSNSTSECTASDFIGLDNYYQKWRGVVDVAWEKGKYGDGLTLIKLDELDGL